MSLPLVKDPTSGNYFTADPGATDWRPLTTEETSRLRPTKVLDEMGVGAGERFTLKNFMNPGVAATWLRARGYEVMPYGSGLNFAVRKSPQEPWKVVDPQKSSVKEFLHDMLDLSVGDVALPALGTAVGAAAGGLPGAVAGAMGAEALREGIGSAISGESANISPTQIGIAGAATAALPLVGKALSPVVRGGAKHLASGLSEFGTLTRAGETLLSRLTGIRPAEGMRVWDIINYRARNGSRSFVTPDDTLNVLQSHMDEVGNPTIGRLVAQRDALTAGATVNMRPILEAQLTSRGERGALIKELVDYASPDRLDPQAVALVDELRGLLNPPTRAAARAAAGDTATRAEVQAIYDDNLERWLFEMEKLPASVAARVRSGLQQSVVEADAAAYAGVTAGQAGAAKPISDAKIRDIRDFVGKWTKHFHTDLDGQGLGDVGILDEKIHTSAAGRDWLRKYFGITTDSAENSIRRAYEPGNTRFVNAVKAYDAAFPGVEWSTILKRIALPQTAAAAPGTGQGLLKESFSGAQFTPRIGRAETYGLAEAISRPTATGSPLGLAFTSSLIGGAAGAVGGGGPLGALAGGALGGAAGFLAFSPRALVAVAPKVAAGGRILQGAAKRFAVVQAPSHLGPITAGAVGIALQGIARNEFGKSLVQQDTGQRPRRAVFIGEPLPATGR